MRQYVYGAFKNRYVAQWTLSLLITAGYYKHALWLV